MSRVTIFLNGKEDIHDLFRIEPETTNLMVLIDSVHNCFKFGFSSYVCLPSLCPARCLRDDTGARIINTVSLRDGCTMYYCPYGESLLRKGHNESSSFSSSTKTRHFSSLSFKSKNTLMVNEALTSGEVVAQEREGLPLPSKETLYAAQRILKNSPIYFIPLIKLHIEDEERNIILEDGDKIQLPSIYLKLENLQPIGSFKLRGAFNAILSAKENGCDLSCGVATASAGNMGQGVAWCAKKLGLSCEVVVPEHAPSSKLNAIIRLGARITKVPFNEWWRIIQTHRVVGKYIQEDSTVAKAYFIHPVCNEHVIAGNATIGAEIIEEMSDVDVILVPYGGGALSTGIASAIKMYSKTAKVFATEVETACPLSASFKEGKPVEVTYTPSFVDGIGGKSVLEEMWPLAQSTLDGSLVASLNQVTEAIITLIERNRVVAEGAGATTVAVALSGTLPKNCKKVVCVISGGGINKEVLIECLKGNIPTTAKK